MSGSGTAHARRPSHLLCPPGPAWRWGPPVPTPPSPAWLSPAPSSSAPGPTTRLPATLSPSTLRVRERRGARGGHGGGGGGGECASSAHSSSPAPPGDESEIQGTLEFHVYKSHQWLGASVTSWDGKLLVGASGWNVGRLGWRRGGHPACPIAVPRSVPRCSTGTRWRGSRRRSAPRRAPASCGARAGGAPCGIRPAATRPWPAPTARQTTVRGDRGAGGAPNPASV